MWFANRANRVLHLSKRVYKVSKPTRTEPTTEDPKAEVNPVSPPPIVPIVVPCVLV